MLKVLAAAVLAVILGTMLGWIGALSDIANSVHERLYGAPLAHPNGNTADHLNDWLTFLPKDALTRGVIVGGTIAALLVLIVLINMLGILLAHHRKERAREAEARARTISSYRKI